MGRGRRTEVVALGFGVGQKGFIDDTANRVQTHIGGIGATAAVPEPAGHGFTTADLQGLTEDIELSSGCGRGGWGHGNGVKGRC